MIIINILIHEYMNNRDYLLFELSNTSINDLKDLQNIVYDGYSKQPHISIERSILKALYQDIGSIIYP